MTDEKKIEIANKIKKNIDNPEKLKEILLNLSVEEWKWVKLNSELRKIIENALGKGAIDNIEEKRREAAKAEERCLKAQEQEESSVTVHDDDDYLPT